MIYERIQDIPQFPHAGYQVNIGWDYVDEFFSKSAIHVNLNPDYQRGYVWSQYQKERYIEYRLQGGISGRDIFLNCPNWTHNIGITDWHETLELVDGKQRINAVRAFMAGEVKAFGKTLAEYADHEIYIRRMRYDFIFRINNLATKKEVVEWYLGINAGGSIHTEDDLKTARTVLSSLEN